MIKTSEPFPESKEVSMEQPLNIVISVSMFRLNSKPQKATLQPLKMAANSSDTHIFAFYLKYCFCLRARSLLRWANYVSDLLQTRICISIMKMRFWSSTETGRSHKLKAVFNPKSHQISVKSSGKNEIMFPDSPERKEIRGDGKWR